MKTLPRDQITVLWHVEEQEDRWALKASMYRKDEPVRTPRAVGTVEITKELTDTITIEQLIALAEERIELDLHEMNGTGPFDGSIEGNDPNFEYQKQMRQAFGLLEE